MLMTIKINLKLCTQESRMTSVVGFILATIRFIQQNLMVSTYTRYYSFPKVYLGCIFNAI